MDRIRGRGPGYVFIRKPADEHARWYRVETVDLLSRFESELDKDVERVVDYSTDWCTGLDAKASTPASIYCDLY